MAVQQQQQMMLDSKVASGTPLFEDYELHERLG